MMITEKLTIEVDASQMDELRDLCERIERATGQSKSRSDALTVHLPPIYAPCTTENGAAVTMPNGDTVPNTLGFKIEADAGELAEVTIRCLARVVQE